MANLGENYVSQMLATYAGRVSGAADLVCYWFAKAGRQVATGNAKRAGLVATNSIRGGANRRALEAATDTLRIFDAWSDEPWVVDGAAVRVSLICFTAKNDDSVLGTRLDGDAVDQIFTDLTARAGRAGVDLTGVQRLSGNVGVAFRGDEKGGPFDIAGNQAREWLRLPANPNGRSNSDVLSPWVNGLDLNRRPSGKWIIDFGWTMSEGDAALYEEPFRRVQERVYPSYAASVQGQRKPRRKYWWRHARPYPEMRRALSGLSRYIATTRHSKHRLFVWCDSRVCPDSALVAVARDDDTTFGILHSRFHELWARRLGSSLEDRPRYTPTTTFETFPFPEGLTPDIPADEYADDPRAIAISEAARRLVELRDRWLNPPEWVEWVDEPMAGYPKRAVPTAAAPLRELGRRTLTNLYNERPRWLVNAHAQLDAAVSDAYGSSSDKSDDEILSMLLQLNLARSND